MIIGISGKAQSGKDTTGGHLLRMFSGHSFSRGIGWHPNFNEYERWTIEKFAKKLKRSIQFKFPNLFSEALWEENHNGYRDVYLSPLKMTRRQLLINEAMALRGICADYWVMALLDEYRKETISWNAQGEEEERGFPNWIITDLRFTNEFKAIKDMGGICIRVNRPGIPIIDSISETQLDDCKLFDYVIENDGDEIELIYKIESIYNQIKNKVND